MPPPLDPRRDPAWESWSTALRTAARSAAAAGEDDVVRRALLVVADRLGGQLGGRPGPPLSAVPPIPESMATPDLLGAALEALLEPDDRRVRGRHHTSPDLALDLLTWALAGWPRGQAAPQPVTAVDPGAGAGAFLLAAARWQAQRGVARGEALAGLVGVDVDPLAVAVARCSLALWADDTPTPAKPQWRSPSGVDQCCSFGRGVSLARAAAPGPTVVAGDGLEGWPSPMIGAAAEGGVDLVVGNPPFLGQLYRSTARDRATAARLRGRYGQAAAGYVDTAAVFLLAAAQRVRPGGRVVLIVPTSVLAARDAALVRDEVSSTAPLTGLWVACEPAFSADVDVCAVVLERPDEGADARQGPSPAAARRQRFASESSSDVLARRQRIDSESPSDGALDRRQRIDSESPPDGSRAGPRPSRASLVALSRGLAFEALPPAPRPDPRSWAPLLAAAHGVPDVDLDTSAGVVGDLAHVTAGFRQHFYALAPHIGELAGDDGHLVPVLTTGLVDPLAIRWGCRGARLAGRTWTRPGVDLDAVERDDAAIAAWARGRLRPKVVVASQTRVVEAAVDATGRFVPGVPLVSVEPPTGDDHDLWLVAAALSAPPVTAWARRESAGTARHREALKLAARQVRAVPLPPDRMRWHAAARDLAAGRALVDVGADLTVAYGLDVDHPVTAWWTSRLPRPGAR